MKTKPTQFRLTEEEREFIKSYGLGNLSIGLRVILSILKEKEKENEN
jgi:hypothetical protein